MKSGILPALILALLLCGCASVSRNPVPESSHLEAVVLDGADVRLWGDDHRSNWIESFESDIKAGRYAGIMHREHHYLLISGGGDNGAYGAGVLTGWSEGGVRPEFTIVTGISTGALTAPFAFLGSDYDEVITRLYTTTHTERIYRERSLLSIFTSDAALDTSPLVSMLESYVDDELIRAIEAEGRKGRRLYIGTTNLDAGRPVIWDITAIATSGHPEAGQLIRKVLLASAAIPGAFPPVYIPVTTPDGPGYDEMHVDGGASSQFFFYPSDLQWNQVVERLDVRGKPNIYVIRNGRLTPEYETVNPRTLDILGRSVSSLIRTQSQGDFYRVWSLAQRDGLDVQVSLIPDQTDLPEPREAFDPVYLKALYNLGRQQALAGSAFRDLEKIMLDQ